MYCTYKTLANIHVLLWHQMLIQQQESLTIRAQNIYPTSNILKHSQILFEENSSRTTRNIPPFVYLNQAKCLLKHAQLTSCCPWQLQYYPLARSEHTIQHSRYCYATSPAASFSASPSSHYLDVF